MLSTIRLVQIDLDTLFRLTAHAFETRDRITDTPQLAVDLDTVLNAIETCAAPTPETNNAAQNLERMLNSLQNLPHQTT